MHVHLSETERRALATQEPFNFGLEPKHARHFSNVSSGLHGVSVTLLSKGMTLYRFNTSGRSPGGWWSTGNVMQAIQAMARATGHSEALIGRNASAVLSDWNKCNELLAAEVVHSCMAFTGMGRPQSEVVPFTNFKIVYEKCREIPQLFIPNSHWMDQTIKHDRLITHRVIKTYHDHEGSPTLGIHKTAGQAERDINASLKPTNELKQPLLEELRYIEGRLPTAHGQAKINLQNRKKEILASLRAFK